jgi:dipeptidyl aminopeptidase/acylaminoacyl peptidase
VTYAVFEDEGHGFSQPANMLRFVAAGEKFLSDNLGGRIQPLAPEESIDAFLR